ncbi:sigma-70 family RNA polymerase sigma factor [Actinacidiphila alni]|uniref:sigma-70 family RNA polymerase sigma factor n=1 Tax=Actinacidiphila alni TaxID=380248 RepID=UPI0033CA146E
MDVRLWSAGLVEEHGERLHAVAYRMLGSASEADDAVQEAWLRVSAADTEDVENIAGWLTTVVARVCLNMLRTRERRREEPLDVPAPDRTGGGDAGRIERDPGAGAAGRVVGPPEVADPEREAVLAESVGLAMLVVLDTLTPAERIAFVLHDMFAVPFDGIGTLLERSPAAVRQLASRARRRVKGVDSGAGQGGAGQAAAADRTRHREVVEAYFAASRDGDFEALLALLDPDVVLRADAAALPGPEPVVLRGVRAVAGGATAAAERVRLSQPALVNGRPGLVMAPLGRLAVVLDFTVVAGRITAIDVIADPGRLRTVTVAVLG